MELEETIERKNQKQSEMTTIGHSSTGEHCSLLRSTPKQTVSNTEKRSTQRLEMVDQAGFGGLGWDMIECMHLEA